VVIASTESVLPLRPATSSIPGRATIEKNPPSPPMNAKRSGGSAIFASPCPSWYATRLSIVASARSTFPSSNEVTRNAELGV
jgi:hypothetical protein